MSQMVFVYNYQFRELEGKMLTLLETLGLPDKQEKAIKTQVRRAIWDSWDNSFLLPSDLKEELFKRENLRRAGDLYTEVYTEVGSQTA